MAHRKAGGTAKNLRDSQPKYLGTKLYAGQSAKVGDVIVRQRGTRIIAGPGIGLGKDHTLFARRAGRITFKEVRKIGYDGRRKRLKMVLIED